jgi:hypothetical protein
MSAHQREEAQNGGFSPESVLNYLEIWLRRPPPTYVAFSRGLGVNKTVFRAFQLRRSLLDITYSCT